MDIAILRKRRRAAGISGQLLATRAHVNRGRLSCLERGQIDPTPAEMERLERALVDLEKAKRVVAAAAEGVGLTAL